MERFILAALLLPVIGALLLPAAGAFAAYPAGKRAGGIAGVIGFAEMIEVCVMASYGGEVFVPEICGVGLHFTLDGFRGIYSILTAFLFLMAILFSNEYLLGKAHAPRHYSFLLMTLSFVLGVFLAADLFTAFLFFELMSFASFVWVIQEETEEAIRAAQTYLAAAVAGGMALLMGLFLLQHALGTLEISQLRAAAAACGDKGTLWAAGVLALAGFGAKAGAFPLHFWMPKAYPAAPAPSSALLTGILAKVGIFGIIAISCGLFWGSENWGLLVFGIGLITMFGGALLAVCSIDVKRTLACSSMSQIGFILLGVGMQAVLGEDGQLAARGTFLHMINHSLMKLTLFLAAGVIVMNLHARSLNEIRGFGRKKPLLKLCFLSGALGISGIPLFGGYVSKTLLHESILEGAHYAAALSGFLRASEWLFLISGGMTFAYMAKLYVAIFVEKHPDAKTQARFDGMKQYMNPLSAAALLSGAVCIPVLGMIPRYTADPLADLGETFWHFSEKAAAVSYFSMENLKGALISIAIGAVLYACIRRLMRKERDGILEYKDAWPGWLDIEELLYRPLLFRIFPAVAGVACRILDSLADGILLALRKTVYRDRKIPHELAEGTEFTHLLGAFLDLARQIRRKILRQEAPEHEVSYEHKLAMHREKIVETNAIIQRSLSFGLLMFYVGLVFTLLYLGM